MRSLIRSRPHVDIFVVVELAIVIEKIMGPGLDNDIEGFFKARSPLSERDAKSEILTRNAADESGDNATASKVVQHRELLRHAQRVAVEREQIPGHSELDSFRFGGDISQKNVG